MDFEKDIKKKIIQSDFSKNNGRIIRTVNLLSGKYINLHTAFMALEEYMDMGKFKSSIDYLYRSCYIEIRVENTKKIISDMDRYTLKEMEMTLTQKGIKIAMGYIEDEAVEI